ncbi:hypothetical protein M0R04_13360 [Candidatus Dojkabacteria bacterium]|jgi:hypothetical protein|nr:hypothetical protein [Candidatus Dojkabacteria bacterium]
MKNKECKKKGCSHKGYLYKECNDLTAKEALSLITPPQTDKPYYGNSDNKGYKAYMKTIKKWLFKETTYLELILILVVIYILGFLIFINL